MPRLEANLQFMFNEHELLDRYDAAAKAGFKGVELQSPYSVPVEQIVERLERNSLRHVIINMPMNDPDTGKGNVPLRPDRKDLYKERVAQGAEYAAALGCIGVNVGVGPLDDIEEAAARETLVENLRHVATELEKVGVKALIEAINTRDQPGFYIHTTAQTRQIIEEAGHSNLYIQYDFYHMQIMEGDLAPTVKENLDQIAHMQLADTPGRNEPGTGEINYDFLLPYLDEINYTGWVGCEYRPSGETTKSLGWAKKWLS